MTGGELFHYLAEEDQVSEEVAAKFIKKILDGLKHMHDKNVCHLDLKVWWENKWVWVSQWTLSEFCKSLKGL